MSIEPRYSDDPPINSFPQNRTKVGIHYDGKSPKKVLVTPKANNLEVKNLVSIMGGRSMKISCLPKPFPKKHKKEPKKDPITLPCERPMTDKFPHCSPGVPTCPNISLPIGEIYQTPTKTPRRFSSFVRSRYPHLRPPSPPIHNSPVSPGMHPYTRPCIADGSRFRESFPRDGLRANQVSFILTIFPCPLPIIILKNFLYQNQSVLFQSPLGSFANVPHVQLRAHSYRRGISPFERTQLIIHRARLISQLRKTRRLLRELDCALHPEYCHYSDHALGTSPPRMYGSCRCSEYLDVSSDDD